MLTFTLSQPQVFNIVCIVIAVFALLVAGLSGNADDDRQIGFFGTGVGLVLAVVINTIITVWAKT